MSSLQQHRGVDQLHSSAACGSSKGGIHVVGDMNKHQYNTSPGSATQPAKAAVPAVTLFMV
jgi:hypothetical protein